MHENNTPKIKLFYSYAHADSHLRVELAKQLDRHYIEDWYDREILPGTNWVNEIDEHLDSANIILLLLSPDFKSSNYCTGIEMKRALERQAAGEVMVIPIRLRAVEWENPPFWNLQFRPSNGKPVTAWSDRDAAFADIANGIHRVAKELLNRQQDFQAKSKYIASADAHMAAKNYNLAITAYGQAMRILPPHDASLYRKLSRARTQMGDTQGALNAIEQAIALSPEDADLYAERGVILYSMRRYQQALDAYEQALKRNDQKIQFYRWKCQALRALKRFDDARTVYLEAINRDKNNHLLRKEYGDILVELGHLPAARDAYDKAIALNENFSSAYQARGELLERMAQQLTNLAQKDLAKAKKLGDEHM